MDGFSVNSWPYMIYSIEKKSIHTWYKEHKNPLCELSIKGTEYKSQCLNTVKNIKHYKSVFITPKRSNDKHLKGK